MIRDGLFTQINVHLYFDKVKDSDLIEQVQIFKAKRKFNPLVLRLLREYIEKQRDSFILDFSPSQDSSMSTASILKSIDRIESVMSVSSDRAASLSVFKELELLKSHFKSEATT